MSDPDIEMETKALHCDLWCSNKHDAGEYCETRWLEHYRLQRSRRRVRPKQQSNSTTFAHGAVALNIES